MKTLSVFLIFLLAVNIGCVSIIQLAYQSNVAYFTENFCVNKSKPQMQCNGKCHLNKVIKKTNNFENKISKSIVVATTYLAPIKMEIFINNISNFVKYIFHYSQKITFQYIAIPSKPPQVC